jgi:uncharacterized membrane protein
MMLPLALLQVVASFALLAVSSEAETVVRYAIHSTDGAPLQVPSFWVLLALAALPLVVALLGIARRSSQDHVLALLFGAFLLIILVASAQGFGAWRLWYEHVSPASTPN